MFPLCLLINILPRLMIQGLRPYALLRRGGRTDNPPDRRAKGPPTGDCRGSSGDYAGHATTRLTPKPSCSAPSLPNHNMDSFYVRH